MRNGKRKKRKIQREKGIKRKKERDQRKNMR